VAYLLAIASAALYGAADFLGGLGSRRASSITIVASSQAAGLAALLLVLPLLPPAFPLLSDFAWGAVAGLAGGIGVALLYRALAVGTMAVVAPTTAVCAVTIPVAAVALAGERLAAVTMAGIGLAMLAIVLVSRETPVRPGVAGSSLKRDEVRTARSGVFAPGVSIALASGVAIGFFFLALARTETAAGMWPLVAARGVSVTLFGMIALARGIPLRMTAPVTRIAVGAGAVDMGANALYLVATRSAALSVVVTLASLYPASTVMLARVVLGERLNRWQIAGVSCALVAIGLIVGGDRSNV
jgi:drug/metabolite transporter (DMT)-like permease